MSSSEEAQMMERIRSGRGTDGDFQAVVERGDRSQKMEVERLEMKKRKEMEHYGRIYGDDIQIFDGVDNNGNLYKDYSLDI